MTGRHDGQHPMLEEVRGARHTRPSGWSAEDDA